MIQSCARPAVFTGREEQEAVSLGGGMEWHTYVVSVFHSFISSVLPFVALSFYV